MAQQPLDTNYKPISTNLYDPSGDQYVSPEAGTVSTDSGGEKYAPQKTVLSATASADNQTASGVSEVAIGKYDGATIDRERIPVVFKTIAAQAITAGTALDLWTPTTGKKFRLMGFYLSSSAAAYLIFKDDSTTILNSPAAAAAGILSSPPMGNGILSATANNKLKLDVSATSTVSGFVFGTEE